MTSLVIDLPLYSKSAEQKAAGKQSRVVIIREMRMSWQLAWDEGRRMGRGSEGLECTARKEILPLCMMDVPTVPASPFKPGAFLGPDKSDDRNIVEDDYQNGIMA